MDRGILMFCTVEAAGEVVPDNDIPLPTIPYTAVPAMETLPTQVDCLTTCFSLLAYPSFQFVRHSSAVDISIGTGDSLLHNRLMVLVGGRPPSSPLSVVLPGGGAAAPQLPP